MESPLKNLRPAASRAVRSASGTKNESVAPTSAREPRRISRKASKTVAVIDIGSNSVRLVVYQDKTRNLAPVFNEKTLCGLGREVQSTGLLAADAVAKALTA